LWAGGGVHGLWGREAFDGPEGVEGLDDFLGVGQNGDEVGLGTGTGSLAGFDLAIEEGGGVGEFFPREAECRQRKQKTKPKKTLKKRPINTQINGEK
jgi:hypothetical protein